VTSALRLAAAFLCLFLALFTAAKAVAHPMPNTVIALAIGEHKIALEIVIPAPELLLAVTGDANRDARAFLEQNAAKLREYMDAHLLVLTKSGARLPQDISAVTLDSASDANVGNYQEFRFNVDAAARAGFDTRDFQLRYDAIIHQIPNHFALVRIAQDFRGGLVGDEKAVELGIIRYDFATASAPPLEVKAGQGSLWTGFAAMVRLGIAHIAGGLDHILFLATLLTVAPLRAVNGGWSLFQGYGYSFRRFLAVSLAFTLGHSAALAAGAYDLLSFNRAAIEVLIALSILISALHALRPLFPNREWQIAGGFGLAHGLAFSESLTGLDLAPPGKALAIFGFNTGVEAAQLLIMAAALPLLYLSRFPAFHTARWVAMALVAMLAALWVGERVIGLGLAGFTVV
jgi:HupE / UreJ protein